MVPPGLGFGAELEFNINHHPLRAKSFMIIGADTALAFNGVKYQSADQHWFPFMQGRLFAPLLGQAITDGQSSSQGRFRNGESSPRRPHL